MEGVHNVGEVPDEATVEVDKAEERLYLLHLLGDWPVGDSLHLHRVHGHFVLGDDKSQVFNFLALELALLCFQEQVVPLQEFKYSAHCLTMFREGLIEGKDVMHEADGAHMLWVLGMFFPLTYSLLLNFATTKLNLNTIVSCVAPAHTKLVIQIRPLHHEG